MFEVTVDRLRGTYAVDQVEGGLAQSMGWMIAQCMMFGNYSAGMADVRQGGTIGLPAKTLVNASMTLPPFLRMVEM